MNRLIIAFLLILSVGVYCKDKKKEEAKADTSYTFKGVEIVGYSDNPTPFYITDADDGENLIIELDKSFSDALKQNIDKESTLLYNK